MTTEHYSMIERGDLSEAGEGEAAKEDGLVVGHDRLDGHPTIGSRRLHLQPRGRASGYEGEETDIVVRVAIVGSAIVVRW